MNKPILWGLGASIALLAVYFSIVTLAESFTHAIGQFIGIWYWVLILVIGFGVQVGLYSHIRISSTKKLTGATAEITAAGGVSTGSMIACCAHHVTDVLPILGLSAASVFLLKYQIPFIVLGIFSNLVGITMMLSIIQRFKLFNKRGLVKRLFKYDMRLVRNTALAISVVMVSLVFINTALTGGGVSAVGNGGSTFNLPAKTNSDNGVSISVQPIGFALDNEVKFDVALNTHQGSLNFDLTNVSTLEDSAGNVYKPTSWSGSPPGGHHRHGTLTFPKLVGQTTYIKLTMINIYNVPERVFTWSLG